jgi:hypothetical protein
VHLKFDFNAVAPYPSDVSTDSDGPSQAKTDRLSEEVELWRLKNWGTKWNAYGVTLRYSEGMCLTFQTAWSPPIPVIAALHRRFPKCRLALEYFEGGFGFCGGVTWEALTDEGDYDSQTDGEPDNEWSSEYFGERGG